MTTRILNQSCNYNVSVMHSGNGVDGKQFLQREPDTNKDTDAADEQVSPLRAEGQIDTNDNKTFILFTLHIYIYIYKY